MYFFDWASILIPPLISAAALVGVGYWIHTTIRRKSQRDLILVNYLQDIQRKIHEHVDSAVEASSLEKCTNHIRSLSNEVHHFDQLPFRHIALQSSLGTDDKLLPLVFQFKEKLTGSGVEIDEAVREQSRQIGRDIKVKLLENIFEICETKKG